MKKVLSALLLAGLIVFSALAMTACEKKGEATVYGKVYEHYVGIATVAVSGDKVTSCKFDELFTPFTWADFTGNEDFIPSDTGVVKATKRNAVRDLTFAQYIQVDGINYELKNAGNIEEAEHAVYKAMGGGTIQDLEAHILTNSDNGKAYADAISAKKFAIMKMDGETLVEEKNATQIAEILNYDVSLLKSKSGYWSGSSYPLGWKGNIEKLEKFIVDNNFGAFNASTTYTPDATTKTFKVGEIDTQATLTFFNDYMRLAHNAYQKALGN